MVGLGWHQRLPFIRELDDIDKHRIALELEASQNMARWAVKAYDANGRRVWQMLEGELARLARAHGVNERCCHRARNA